MLVVNANSEERSGQIGLPLNKNKDKIHEYILYNVKIRKYIFFLGYGICPGQWPIPYSPYTNSLPFIII